VVIKSSVFWDITPYSPLKVNRRFGGGQDPHRVVAPVKKKNNIYIHSPEPYLLKHHASHNVEVGVKVQRLCSFHTTIQSELVCSARSTAERSKAKLWRFPRLDIREKDPSREWF
jgi:hypothetical protein